MAEMAGGRYKVHKPTFGGYDLISGSWGFTRPASFFMNLGNCFQASSWWSFRRNDLLTNRLAFAGYLPVDLLTSTAWTVWIRDFTAVRGEMGIWNTVYARSTRPIRRQKHALASLANRWRYNCILPLLFVRQLLYPTYCSTISLSRWPTREEDQHAVSVLYINSYKLQK